MALVPRVSQLQLGIKQKFMDLDTTAYNQRLGNVDRLYRGMKGRAICANRSCEPKSREREVYHDLDLDRMGQSSFGEHLDRENPNWTRKDYLKHVFEAHQLYRASWTEACVANLAEFLVPDGG